MKNFGKILCLISGTVLFIGIGYHLVMVNLATMLGTGRIDYEVTHQSGKVKLRAGHWVETIRFQTPVSVSHKEDAILLESALGTLTVTKFPEFKVDWKKPPRQAGE